MICEPEERGPQCIVHEKTIKGSCDVVHALEKLRVQVSFVLEDGRGFNV